MDVGAAKVKATKSSLRGNAKNFKLQAEKHAKSDNTKKRYMSSLKMFVLFLEEQNQKQESQRENEQELQEASDDDGDGDDNDDLIPFAFEEFFDIQRFFESKDPIDAFFSYAVPPELIYSFLHTAQYKKKRKAGKKKLKRMLKKGTIIEEVDETGEELISDSHLGNHNSAIVYLFKQKEWQMEDKVSALMNLNRKSFKKIKVNTRLWMYPYF